MYSTIQPEREMKAQALSSFNYAQSYHKTALRDLESTNRRFDNDLLYNLISMSFEKYMVALLARYDWNASSHLPVLLYKEALIFEPELDATFKETAKLIGSFESICSLDSFGYKTPNDLQIKQMIEGLDKLNQHVTTRMTEIT
ncbi:MAG: hypothetical protein AB7D40_08035 [Bacteroidales bacterium]